MKNEGDDAEWGEDVDNGNGYYDDNDEEFEDDPVTSSTRRSGAPIDDEEMECEMEMEIACENDESTMEDDLSDSEESVEVRRPRRITCMGGFCVFIAVTMTVLAGICGWHKIVALLPAGVLRPATSQPTNQPSLTPSMLPTLRPSVHPSLSPSALPSTWPSLQPSVSPTLWPTTIPTVSPSSGPTSIGDKLKIDTWSQIGQSVEGRYRQSFFGHDMAMSADASCIVVSAVQMIDVFINNNDPLMMAGQVRIFKLSEANQWEQVGQDLNGTDFFGHFGWSVDISNSCSTVVIGERYHTNAAIKVIGQVKMYRLVNGSWTQISSAIKCEQDVDGTSEMGSGVALSDNEDIFAVAAVSYRGGLVRVYKYSSTDDSFTQLGQDLTGRPVGVDESRDRFGHSISISSLGDVVAVGIPGYDYLIGRVEVFQLVNNIWVARGQGINGTIPTAQFGTRVSISGDATTLAIGTRRHIEETPIFRYMNDSWIQLGQGIVGMSPTLSFDGNLVALVSPDLSGFMYYTARVFALSNDEWIQIGQDLDDGTNQTSYNPMIALVLSGDGADGQYLAMSIAYAGTGKRIYAGVTKIYKGIAIDD